MWNYTMEMQLVLERALVEGNSSAERKESVDWETRRSSSTATDDALAAVRDTVSELDPSTKPSILGVAKSPLFPSTAKERPSTPRTATSAKDQRAPPPPSATLIAQSLTTPEARSHASIPSNSNNLRLQLNDDDVVSEISSATSSMRNSQCHICKKAFAPDFNPLAHTKRRKLNNEPDEELTNGPMDMDISTPDFLEHSAGGTGVTQQALKQLLGHKIADSPAIPQGVETHSFARNTETLKYLAPPCKKYKVPITKSVLVKAPTLQEDASEIAFAAEIRRELDAHCRKQALNIPGRNDTTPSTPQSRPQLSTSSLLTQAEAASSKLAGTPKSSSISSLSDREFTDVAEQDGVTREQEQEHEPASSEQKPWYHLTQLMAMALLDAPEQRLKTADIWNWICEHFPYYKKHDKRSSIGAYLTTESAFEKIKTPDDPPFAPHFHQLKIGFEHRFFTFENRPLVQPRDSRLSSALQKEKTTREAMAMKRRRVSKSTDHSQPLKRISASRFRRTTDDVTNDTFVDNSTILDTQNITPGTEESRILKLKLRKRSKATHIDDTYDTDAPLVSTPLSGRHDRKDAQVAKDVDSPPDTSSSRTLNDSVTRGKASSIHDISLAEQQMPAEGEDKENPDSEAEIGLAKLAALRARIERLDRQRDNTMAKIYCHEHRSEAPKHALMVQYHLENLMKGETGGRDFNGDNGQLDDTMFDEAAKIEEIKRRPSRKATFGRKVKNGGHLRTSGFFSTNRPGPLTCEVDPLRTSAKKGNMRPLDLQSLADALGLPRNPIPVFHKGQLAYRDGTLNSNGELPRAKAIYLVGHNDTD
ncbi:hypothetical protein B0A49_04872 [Cryomyces minteri]|uniref:Fork-head domain-containing protein n=1 Tax=Cryomyces minteri TaxID=331657 RepID=A0A4U0WR59_9PEZI|nr:hypothetical protein B0A49_04872 [Cryomyces minteri]